MKRQREKMHKSNILRQQVEERGRLVWKTFVSNLVKARYSSLRRNERRGSSELAICEILRLK